MDILVENLSRAKSDRADLGIPSLCLKYGQRYNKLIHLSIFGVNHILHLLDCRHTIVTFPIGQDRYLRPRNERRASLRAREDSDAETSCAASIQPGTTTRLRAPLALAQDDPACPPSRPEPERPGSG